MYNIKLGTKEFVVTIRQQIGLEETIVKEIEQNQLNGTAMFREWRKEDYPKQH